MRTMAGIFTLTLLAALCLPAVAQAPVKAAQAPTVPPLQNEQPEDAPAAPPPRVVSPPAQLQLGRATSVQVNVDEFGNNIVGDAANEPSIAIDPRNHNVMVIGWRQFDSITSNFRQAGWGYSHTNGRKWTFPGVIQPGVFRSDPVLDSNSDGTFFYNSLTTSGGSYYCDVFRSFDGGMTWDIGYDAYGGDKQWMAIDRTQGIGDGNIYMDWTQWYGTTPGSFTRSIDDGITFMWPIDIPTDPYWGTIAVGPDGEVYVAGEASNFTVAKSTNAQDPGTTPKFDFYVNVNLGGGLVYGGDPNPDGLAGQCWIACDKSDGPTRGYVYLLASVNPSGSDPLDVMFSRSTDGGKTWTPAKRINDDPLGTNAWQWFGTMSVAPNGRIDVIWNDTREGPTYRWSRLYYAYSTDGGLNWSKNEPLTPAWDSWLGWPKQNKIGDYYHMISDNVGADLAYAATFNGEEDVYYMRIGEFDCNSNGIPDSQDIASGFSTDLNGNGVPDECDGLGDLNCDGTVTAFDIDPFVLALTDPAAYKAAYPKCDASRGDINGDGAVDAFDIDPFVQILTGG